MSRRILQIHKIIDRMTLEYLRDKLPPNRRLFLPTIFRNIKCRANRYSNSFFPDDIASWNNMITHFEHFPTIANLKKHMLSLIRPEAELIYVIHDSNGLRYLLQSRVSLSSLRSHKRRHNFIDTPSDICHCNQGIEDRNTFLFSCPTNVNPLDEYSLTSFVATCKIIYDGFFLIIGLQ